MWSKYSRWVVLPVVCLCALAACILAPSTSFPNSNEINTDLLPGMGVEQEDEQQVVQCFVPMELTPIAFSPDNSQVAVQSSLGVQFINLTDGMEIAFFSATQPVLITALSPDGQTLAWGLGDNSIQIVDVSDGGIRHTLTGHPDPVLHLLFSPSGTELYSASHDGLVRIWNVQTGMLRDSINIGAEVVGIGVSSDGLVLATVPSDGPIQIWDAHSGDLLGTLGGTGGYDTTDPVFSTEGSFLAADLATGLNLWNVETGSQVWESPVNSMADSFSPDGQWFAYSDIDQENAIILTPSTLAGPPRVVDHMQGPVWKLFFSPDGSLLAASDGIEIRIWRVSDGAQILVGRSDCP